MPSITDFLATPDPPTLWLIDPYVSREGITLIHGKTSIGKSPLTWEMARCVSLGEPFLGFQTTKARVLYVEADTPAIMVRPRLRDLAPPVGLWAIECICGEGYDIAKPSQGAATWLRWAQGAYRPEVVFWNTLQSLTAENISSGETVNRFYHTLRQYFPGSAHVLVHHNRKESQDPDALKVSSESFMGSNGWGNVANVMLHLSKQATHKGLPYLRLEHSKTQASPIMDSVKFTLHENGTILIPDDRLARFKTMLFAGCTETEVISALSISRATFFRWKHLC